MWHMTWNLPISQKLKIFLWKCWNGYISTTNNLVKRGLDCDPICHVCGDAAENLEHIFFTCPRAQDCWKMLGVHWNHMQSPECNFQGWWEDLCNAKNLMIMEDRMSLCVYMLWWLWKTRCSWLFSKTWKDTRAVVTGAKTDWLEFQNHNSQSRLSLELADGKRMTTEESFSQQVRQQTFAFSAWFSPEGKLGMGCRAWHERGILQDWTDTALFSGELVAAKMWTIRWRLLKIAEHGWSSANCVVQDKALVSLLSEQERKYLTGSIVLEDIYHLKSNFDVISFSFDKLKVDIVSNMAKQALKEH